MVSRGEQATDSPLAKPRRPRGGKALRRLFQYFAERDRALNDDVVRVVRLPKSERPRFSMTPEAASASLASLGDVTDRARPSRSKTIAENLASELIAAASAPRSTFTPSAPKTIPSWRSLGPDLVKNGQTYGSNRVDVVGRVSAIAVDPSNGQHLLSGAAAGGIWESSDGGTSWSPRTDQMPSLAIGAIAFDPSDPSHVLAGSGEGNFYSSLGAGIYSSSDGGSTWSVLATSPFAGSGFFSIVIDPSDASRVYAATTIGFYSSTDGGATWTPRKDGPCWDISIHPSGGPSAEILATFQDGLFVSTTGGASFSMVAIPGAPKTWKRLAVDRVKTAPDVAYLFGASRERPYLWRRVGKKWTRVALPAPPVPPIDVNQAWYDWYVAACPDSSSQVFLGAIDAYRGDLVGGVWAWHDVTTQGANSIHPDQHCLTFSPNDSKVIFAGCDGGIFCSTDSGATWSSLNSGLSITETTYLASDPTTSNWLMAGTQDNGTITFTGSTTWDHIADGDGGGCGVNQLNPNEIYHSYYNVSLEKSTNKGKTWTAMSPPYMASLFYPPVGVFQQTVCIGGEKLLVTRNAAAPWTSVALSLGANDVATAIRVADADTIYLGTEAGRLFKIAWSSGAWRRTALTSPFAAYISAIATDMLDPNRLWVTSTEIGLGNQSVSRSDDGGVTWTPCAAGLPSIPKNCAVVDPADSSRVWVSADVGVYETMDAGTTWALFGTGLPNALAADLVFHEADRKLICGTRSRGVWMASVPGGAVGIPVA
jgi:photosystem II stability/assembly factor-like uncharacterized protein